VASEEGDGDNSIPTFRGVGLSKTASEGGHHAFTHHRSLRSLLLANAVMLAVAPAVAADVTPERLAKAGLREREPRIDATGRRRLPPYRRTMGRALQDRRPLR
jgi:hypothetical protein